MVSQANPGTFSKLEWWEVRGKRDCKIQFPCPQLEIMRALLDKCAVRINYFDIDVSFFQWGISLPMHASADHKFLVALGNMAAGYGFIFRGHHLDNNVARSDKIDTGACITE